MPSARDVPPARYAPSPGPMERHWALALFLLAAITLLIRARFFGNPIIDADEEWYLLAGDRLLHGALPYVDIWDRKPPGLFVLFAGIRLLGGDGVLAYQLVAAGFVVATVLLIATLARRIAPPGAALAAALSYPLLLGLSGGQGGQTPVFYNLPVAAAAWLVVGRVIPFAERPAKSLRLAGAAAMLLVGLALQIKPTAVFEGVYFGIVLLWLAWRADPRVSARLADAAIWIAAALLPSAIAFLVYAGLGHGDAFLYANVTSIFDRAGIGAVEEGKNFRHALARVAPVLAMVVIGETLLRSQACWRSRREAYDARLFLIGWLLAAVGGFLVFGTYFNHYALPLLPPLVVTAAPAFATRRRWIGAALATILLVSLGIWYTLNAARLDLRKGDAAYGYQLAGRIRPLLGRGCMFVFYGEPIFYHLSGSCLPTRWAFPYHLSLTREANALGVDAAGELRRILATRPTVILTKRTDDSEMSLPMRAILDETLRRDYRLVYAHRLGGRDPETDLLYARLRGR